MGYDNEQQRGDRSAYERYLAGMDASLQQKVALTAAHLLSRGAVADMGMGSGAQSHALAALYPSLEVVGVDVSAQMVELASERYSLPNLSFRLGDIAARVFEDGSLDAILNSSVLHHVTSFTGYERAAAVRALAVQAAALREGGVLVVRDFLDPGAGEVLLDVKDDDGDDGDDPRSCSTAALLRRFSREARSLHEAPGFPLEELADAASLPGARRFRLRWTHAVEFVLRKDYRADWELEAKEEYTYATQAELEESFAALGLRVLVSCPLRNPWIVAHRFRDQIALFDVEGRALDDPATNYIIVGEKVKPDEGVRFDSEPAPPLGYLELTHYQDRVSGAVLDLVNRPNLTVDVLPWFSRGNELFIVARMSYPRPILRCAPQALDGARAPDYVTEPIAVVQGDAPLGQTVEEALQIRAGVPPSCLRGFAEGATYYPSPGGLREEVRSMLVEVDPLDVSHEPPGGSGFSTSGRVGSIEASQLLRAAQVGGMADARLEMNVHLLLRRLGRAPGPWIGAALSLPPREELSVTTPSELRARPARRRFMRASTSAGFLELRCARFDERAADGRVVASRALEYVVPRPYGLITAAVALLRRTADGVLMGVVDDDRPAAQCIGGNSELLTTPSWRLPHDLKGARAAERWLRERMAGELGAEAVELVPLGGRFHPSPGSTPEVVHAYAVDVVSVAKGSSLLWLRLEELLDAADLLRDGHLRVVAFRAAHALGLLDKPAAASAPG